MSVGRKILGPLEKIPRRSRNSLLSNPGRPGVSLRNVSVLLVLGRLYELTGRFGKFGKPSQIFRY